MPTLLVVEGFRFWFYSTKPSSSKGGMSTSVVSPPNARARSVDFVTDTVVFHLEDGRSVSAPLEWFPRLRDATPEQRGHWELIGPGFGVRWPDIDEDISVAGLLGLPD